jgi:integrase
MSKDYLRDLRSRFTRFCHEFGDRYVASVSVEEIDNWLRDLDLSPQSRVNYRSVIGVLFSHAVRRGMIDTNPIMRTAKPKVPGNPPEIFSVDELSGVLNAATDVAPDVLPMLAIGAFAGLREAEIQRLDWSEVDIARGHIEVKAAKAKSAKRRIVPIQLNLAAWLSSRNGMQGRVVPGNSRRKLDRVFDAAKLARWPNNGLRHSYASYRLAAIHDAPRVAAELGHTSPQMLYSTYRELVLPAEAERYWKIEPTAETPNVVAFSAVS